MAANLGLLLYLFLVGLEVDLRLMISNWRIAVSVGLAGMILPFGLGCGIAYGLYHEFREDSGIKPIAYGTYMLFVGVAMAITVEHPHIPKMENWADENAGVSSALSYPHGAQIIRNTSRSRDIDRGCGQ